MSCCKKQDDVSCEIAHLELQEARLSREAAIRDEIWCETSIDVGLENPLTSKFIEKWIQVEIDLAEVRHRLKILTKKECEEARVTKTS